VGCEDRGIVNVEGVGPVRLIRVLTVEEGTWRNPADGRTFSVRKPSVQLVCMKERVD
jgi:hypothetical protein